MISEAKGCVNYFGRFSPIWIVFDTHYKVEIVPDPRCPGSYTLTAYLAILETPVLLGYTGLDSVALEVR